MKKFTLTKNHKEVIFITAMIRRAFPRTRFRPAVRTIGIAHHRASIPQHQQPDHPHSAANFSGRLRFRHERGSGSGSR